MKRKLCLLLAAVCMAASLSGCAVIRYLVCGDWSGDADLVVISQNSAPIGSIALSQEDNGRVMADARGLALLEKGESYGLQLDEGEEDCIIALLGLGGQELGHTRIHFTGERLYLTLWEDGTVTVSQEDA